MATKKGGETSEAPVLSIIGNAAKAKARPPLDPVAEQLAAIRDELKNLKSVSDKKPGKTFGELAERWFAVISRQRVRPDNERRLIDKLLVDLGHLTEPEMTPSVIKEALSKFDGELAADTINKLRSTGKLIIHHAQFASEWTGLNPFQVVKRKKQVRRRYDTLTPHEFARVLPYVPEHERPPVIVAFATGVRPGELVALRKVDIDQKKGVIHIHRSHDRNETKTGTERTIPIPDSVRELFRLAIERSPCDLVFPTQDGKQYRRDFKWTRKLQWALIKAGIVVGYMQHCNKKGCGHKERTDDERQRACPQCGRRLLVFGIARPVRFYDLRHSMVTNAREAGADPLAIKTVAGHAARDTTDDVYSHLSDEFVREQLNLLRWDVEGCTSARMKNKAEASSSDPRPAAWEACALPTELPPHRSSAGVSSTSLLTVKGVAQYLSCNPRFVYNAVADGKLKARRLGGLLRFTKQDVDAFVERGGE